MRGRGAPLAAAILGSVLSAAYRSQLHRAGLPAAAAGAVRGSVFAGLAVARKLGSATLTDLIRAAFAHGIDAMLWVSATLAVAGTALALAFLPWRATQAKPEQDTAARRAERAHHAAVRAMARTAGAHLTAHRRS